MAPPYRILLVEDNLEDSEIIRYNLTKGGLPADIVRVDTEHEYRERLAAGGVDVILSDANLPRFSGREALEIRNQSAPLVPFILVSGAVGDELAVEFLRNGCVDYVLKEKLTRLPSAVARAAAEAVTKADRARAQESVVESEQRFRRIADSSPMLIWMCDIDAKTTYVNATWCRFTGRTLEEESGTQWFDGVHPDDREMCDAVFTGAFRRRAPVSMEYRLRTAAGDYRWVFDSGVPNHLPTGEFVGYIGSCIDIQDRKEQELALRQSEEKFRRLFDGAPVKVMFDPETLAIVDVNGAAEDFYGWTTDELRRMTIDAITVSTMDDVRSRLRSILAGNARSLTVVHRRKDGSTRHVEVFPTTITIGHRTLVHEIIADITDKVRSEEQLRLNDAALNSARNAMMIADTNGTILWVNPAFSELTGYSREESIGRNPRDILRSGRHDSTFYANLWRTILSGEVWQGELINRRKDGSLFYEEQTITPIRGKDGAVSHFISVKQDISERKRMEEDVRRSKEMLDTFFQQSLDACYFLELRTPIDWSQADRRQEMLDDVFATARIVKANDALRRQFRLTGEEPFTVSPWRMFTGGRDAACDLFGRLFTEGVTYYSTTVKRDADGADIVLEGNAVCIRDGQGRITGFFGIQRDVTDTVREREELQRNEERFKQFFEEDITGDFISRPDGAIVMCNPAFARIYGYPSVDDVQRLNALQLYAEPADRAAWLEVLRRERKVEQYIILSRRADGSTFNARMTAIANVNDLGEIVEVVGYVTDDSRRYEMESQMKQAQKMESIGELSSGVAHDFNNILNNILGFSQQLVKYHTDPGRVLRYADTISKSANRGTEIASKLLTFARNRKTELTVIPLSDIVADVLHVCHETFMHAVEIEADVPPELWKVQGERSGLYQMLLNICMNARDAIAERSPAGRRGTLHVEARNQTVINPDLHWFRQSPPTHCVEIIIRDDGPGIPSDVIEKIFDPFFTTKIQNGQKGTGLGLTVVLSVVKSHHGAIKVHSDEGDGSEFRIYLPAVEYAETDSEAGSMERFRARNNELILLVDDEEGMREMGTEILEESGYRVITAATGAEAVDLFGQRHAEIALVILDLVLPDFDGGQAYLRMKKITPAFKVFFCSGFVTQSVITNLLAEENLGALQKPFRQEKFLKFVYDTLYAP